MSDAAKRDPQTGAEVPADSGASGDQKMTADPIVLPPSILPPDLQHIDYVVGGMRGIGSSTFPAQVYAEIWQMGIGNYQALAHEVRALKEELTVTRAKLANSDLKCSDLRESNAKLKGSVAAGMLRTVCSSAFQSIGGILIGLSFKDSLRDASDTLFWMGLFVLVIGWVVALFRVKDEA